MDRDRKEHHEDGYHYICEHLCSNFVPDSSSTRSSATSMFVVMLSVNKCTPSVWLVWSCVNHAWKSTTVLMPQLLYGVMIPNDE
jgi:hypothetical protein